MLDLAEENETVIDEAPEVELDDVDQLDTDGEDQEVIVSIGEESPPSEDETPAPEWVKELRKNYRETQKRNRELEDKLAATEAKENPPVTLGVKPTLDSCEYDAEKFERELEAWHERKIAVAAQEQKKNEELNQANAAWNATLEEYGKGKGSLNVKDFEDAEDIVKDTLSTTQQGIILQGSKNAALLIYRLGKNPKVAKELSLISDPVKFAFAASDWEKQLKDANKKAATLPEKTIRGSAAVSGTVDSQLERLRADAEKTGNYTKVAAYKQQLRSKGN